MSWILTKLIEYCTLIAVDSDSFIEINVMTFDQYFINLYFEALRALYQRVSSKMLDCETKSTL